MGNWVRTSFLEATDMTHHVLRISPGLGGTGIEEDEHINFPQKMPWEESGNLKQAALGGQVKMITSEKIQQ